MGQILLFFFIFISVELLSSLMRKCFLANVLKIQASLMCFKVIFSWYKVQIFLILSSRVCCREEAGDKRLGPYMASSLIPTLGCHFLPISQGYDFISFMLGDRLEKHERSRSRKLLWWLILKLESTSVWLVVRALSGVPSRSPFSAIFTCSFLDSDENLFNLNGCLQILQTLGV